MVDLVGVLKMDAVQREPTCMRWSLAPQRCQLSRSSSRLAGMWRIVSTGQACEA